MSFRPHLSGITDPEQFRRAASEAVRLAFDGLERTGREILRMEAEKVSVHTLAIQTAPGRIREAVQASGPAALNVENLPGELSQPQKAKLTLVSTLPDVLTDPLSQGGALIAISGSNQIYFFDNSTEPGTWRAISAVGIITQDTHANRLANFPAASSPTGAAFFETDRNAIYINSGTAWVLAVAFLRNTLASRPADLGANDKYFAFVASDTESLYVWTGLAWSLVGNDSQQTYSNANLVLTTTATDISNATLTLNKKGTYLITGIFDFEAIGAGNLGILFKGSLVADGVAQTQVATFTTGTSLDEATVCQQWTYNAPATGKIVKLQALKSGGTGTSQANSGNTSISALWVGP